MSLIERDSVLTTDAAIEYPKISKPTSLKYTCVGRIRPIKAERGCRILQSVMIQILEWRDRIGGR